VELEPVGSCGEVVASDLGGVLDDALVGVVPPDGGPEVRGVGAVGSVIGPDVSTGTFGEGVRAFSVDTM